jgi:tetratricopeptide (TPR) repeat protein
MRQTEVQFRKGRFHRSFVNVFLLSIFVSILFCSASLTAQDHSFSTADGIAAYRNGDFEGTTQILQSVLKDNPQDKTAYLYLGAAFIKLGKQKDALEAFRKSDKAKGFKGPSEKYDQNLQVLSKPRATYTNSARSNNVSGTIKIVVEFGADGKIGFAIPYQTLPEGLTQNAVSAAKQIKFEPAVLNGKPVSVVSSFVYGFEIY